MPSDAGGDYGRPSGGIPRAGGEGDAAVHVRAAGARLLRLCHAAQVCAGPAAGPLRTHLQQPAHRLHTGGWGASFDHYDTGIPYTGTVDSFLGVRISAFQKDCCTYVPGRYVYLQKVYRLFIK